MIVARAALVGFMVVLFVEVACAVVLLVVAHSSGWGDLHLALGPLPFVTLLTSGPRLTLSIHEGVTLLAMAAGALNAAGAYWLRRGEE
jgi:hypothetical protein